jgi:hypothetical protein
MKNVKECDRLCSRIASVVCLRELTKAVFAPVFETRSPELRGRNVTYRGETLACLDRNIVSRYQTNDWNFVEPQVIYISESHRTEIPMCDSRNHDTS